ncbi:MAG: SET domain-containing protein-lysine N-methyltransferase [Burkholderiales bacterium]|nr:SET domain-containing protein-lysine N-methyltransferase [Burkholderiales bacterium]
MRYSNTLIVRPVRNGQGIIALKPFAPGKAICRIRGKIVTGDTVWRYFDSDPRRGDNCFRYDADHYLDPEGEIGAYANHSCHPNSGAIMAGNRLMLKAIRSIAVGDEITHDYSTLLGADDIWKMKCACGEPNCRRVVRNVSRLPAGVLAGYTALGIIPEFILATRCP